MISHWLILDDYFKNTNYVTKKLSKVSNGQTKKRNF